MNSCPHCDRRDAHSHTVVIASGVMTVDGAPPPVPTPWCRVCPHAEHVGPCNAFDVAFQPDNRCPCSVTR